MDDDLNSGFDLDSVTIRVLVENAPVPLAVVDARGRLWPVNRAARELGRDVNLTPIPGALGGGEASGDAIAASEISLPDRRGALRRIHVAPIDLPLGLRVVALRDVTDAAREREELAQLRHIESVGILAARAIHDFNNLLTAILCSSALLSNEVDSSSRAAELVLEIRGAAERAAMLSRQILSLARRPAMPRAQIDANAAIEEMRGLVRLALPEDIELTIACADTPLELVVDRGEFESTLLNLVAIARDAMPVGGRLTIGTASCAADDVVDGGTGSPSPGYVSIAVTDTGAGMPLGARERLFEQFFTTKPSGSGTSLGLASVHAFVRRQGGCVSVRTQPGQGTTVIMYFPRAGIRATVPSHGKDPVVSETAASVQR
jgi:signal transduction histidine kinase